MSVSEKRRVYEGGTGSSFKDANQMSADFDQSVEKFGGLVSAAFVGSRENKPSDAESTERVSYYGGGTVDKRITRDRM